MAVRSLWLQEALAAETGIEADELRGALEADVCIVGGGYVGLWTALRLLKLEADARVLLLEADICGGGPSGRNGGFALSWWPKLETLEHRVGRDEAVRLAHASQSAVAELGAFCEQEEIGAHFHQGGWLWTATSPVQVDSWLGAVEAAGQVGAQPFRLLSAEEVQERTGSPVHLGAAFEERAATVHPGFLARGLRRAALARGVRIFERSPLVTLERERGIARRSCRASFPPPAAQSSRTRGAAPSTGRPTVSPSSAACPAARGSSTASASPGTASHRASRPARSSRRAPSAATTSGPAAASTAACLAASRRSRFASSAASSCARPCAARRRARTTPRASTPSRGPWRASRRPGSSASSVSRQRWGRRGGIDTPGSGADTRLGLTTRRIASRANPNRRLRCVVSSLSSLSSRRWSLRREPRRAPRYASFSRRSASTPRPPVAFRSSSRRCTRTSR